jgi:hypothetical protein
MKRQTILLLSSAGLLHAGAPAPVTPVAPATSAWLTPTIDIRARYEFADVDGFDPSHALTTRERLGLKTTEWNGFSALLEGEFSQAVIDDYNGGAPGADPYDPRNSLIADPQTNELNQGYLQYSGYDTVGRVGRQRLIYDNAAFIGNVGWRQNEQTYDAISLSNQSLDGLTLNYAYVNQVNRIFGSEADGAPSLNPNVQDVGADLHLINLSYTGLSGVTLGGYAYLMDFDEIKGWNNDTFGLSAKSDVAGFTLYGELAWQDDAGPRNNDEAWYAHATVTRAFGKQSLTAGVEFLDAGFQTPLATLHAFNGYADVFVPGRTAGTHGGLTDVYIAHTLPVCWGMKWINALHAFGDNALATDRGWEYDSVLSKKFDDHFTAIVKLAHFETEDKLPTTTRVSMEVNYTF